MTIHLPSVRMEPEKITINLTPVDLGKLDVLVSQGMYASRSDAIRTGIRRLLEAHESDVESAVTRNTMTVGVVQFAKRDLEEHQARGEKVRARTVGLVWLANDITPELADDVFESIYVLGSLRGPRDVLDRLEPKITRGWQRKG